MGNSTTTLVSLFDSLKAKGIFDPRDQPGGVGLRLALDIANDTMSEIIAERFNPKWNSATAPSFYTNSYQQDYPQIGLTAIGWLERADKIDINNTAMPKPVNVPGVTVVRDLARTSLALWPINQVCWKYNSELFLMSWPGPQTKYNPLITTGPVLRNPPTAIQDANGNILVLTTPTITGSGTTGNTAPSLPANSAEGATVNDGTCVWTVAAPTSQGFRVFPLPGATGPVYQITPYYQILLQKLTQLTAPINPIPDDQRYVYRDGLELKCKMASPNPNERAEGLKLEGLWQLKLKKLFGQNNREPDSYGAFPAESVVESVYSPFRGLRNPSDPSQPY